MTLRLRRSVKEQRLEETLIRSVARFLAERGFEAWTHVCLHKLEIDVVARKKRKDRDIIVIVECKLKPKIKLVQQVQARAALANYVYACVPAQYKDIMLRRLPEWCGLMTVKNSGGRHTVQVIRPAHYLGNEEAVYHFSRLLDIVGDRIVMGEYYAPRKITHVPPIFSPSPTSTSQDSSSSSSSGVTLVQVITVLPVKELKDVNSLANILTLIIIHVTDIIEGISCTNPKLN